MADRFGRVQIFQNSMTLCEQNEHLQQSVKHSLETQKIYWEDAELDSKAEKRYADTQILVNNKRTCEAARDFKDKKVCILNFASFVTPGGGVARGATAQEESICRISTLYKCIADESARIFYDSHWEKIRNKQIDRRNNDDIIYTPAVSVFKEDTFDCELLPEDQWYELDVLTCAAPDLRDGFSLTEDELYEIHLKRWRRILEIAALHKTEILILGAYGCGAFRNSPWVVAKAAKKVCDEFAGVFEKIVFAVYTNDYESDNYKAFSALGE